MTIRAVVLSSLIAACSFDGGGVPGASGDDDDDDDAAVDPVIDAGDVSEDARPPSGRFRKAITIAGGTVDETLVDFPMYVELTDPDLVGQGAIHFVAGDGSTALDHELQAWDEDAGHLEAWVRVPAIAAGAATTIYLRYGAFTSPPAEDPAGVFGNGFLAVWHLEDDPDGTAGDIADARGDVDATSASMNGSNRVTGMVGRGLAFGDDLEQLTFTNPLVGASPHTISAWVDADAVAHNAALIVLGNGACTQARWLHARFTGGPIAAGFYCDDWATTAVDVQDDGWVLVHWTYAANATSRLYRDGALAAGPFTHAGTQTTAGTAGFIGNAPAAFGNPMNFEGAVDEIRIADVARSAAWIEAEHVNQRTPATFYAVGGEQALP
jgi:hypothetical protein